MHREGTAKDSKHCSSGAGSQGTSGHLTHSTVRVCVYVMLLQIRAASGYRGSCHGFSFLDAALLKMHVASQLKDLVHVGNSGFHPTLGLDVHAEVTDTHCNLFLQGGKAPAAGVALPAVYNPVEFKHDLMAPVQQMLGDTLDHIPTAIRSEEKSVSSTLQQQLVQAQQQSERQAEPQAAVQQAWDIFAVFRLESQLGLSKGTHKAHKRTTAR